MSIYQLQTFNPAAVTTGSLDTHLTGPCGTIHLLNESLETMLFARDADFSNILGIVPALWAYNLVIQKPPAAIWYKVISTQNAQDSTLQEVQGVSYTQGEDTSHLYTGPLPRIANVGNPSSVNTSGNTLLNTGNAPALTVIEIASTSATGDTANATNDGLWKLAATIAGALKTYFQSFEPANPGQVILQIGNASYTVEAMGTLQVDGNPSLKTVGGINLVMNVDTGQRYIWNINNTAEMSLTGASLILNGVDLEVPASTDLIMNVPTATQAARIQMAGTDALIVGGGTGVTAHNDGVAVNKLYLLNGRLHGIQGGKASGISGVSISHGLGATPAAVSAVTDIAQPGSATIGVGSVGSTTFTATAGAGTAIWWCVEQFV